MLRKQCNAFVPHVPFLFLFRQVTSIIIQAVHDAADATKCSQKEKKCICKVRMSPFQNKKVRHCDSFVTDLKNL